MKISPIISQTILTGLLLTTANARADEGMWLFNAPPRELLKERYHFTPTDAWLEHVQKSSVRFNSGGSGSFVSADGLVMSNHHVGADSLQKVSDEKHNYYRDGFHARTLAEELPCRDLELNVLMSIEDVTDRVNAAVKSGSSPSEAFAQRRAVMAAIEKESTDKTGLRSDVVTLYEGGQYQLYRFKKYTDVRLVFAPEQQVAFYGGDPDNFEYPRFDLDVCFVRAYENGKPARVEHYLKWSKAGAAENELVFVSGHPGHTSRLDTMAELAYTRDHQFPYTLEWLHREEVMLNAYSARTEENARRAKKMLFGVQNSRKAREGGLAGLLDPKIIAHKAESEQKLQAFYQKSPDAGESPWQRIEGAEKIIAEHALDYNLLESGQAISSRYFQIARTLVRAAAERGKPNGDRLREFRESARESLEFALFSDEPLYDDFEQIKLADSLTWFAEKRGFTDELVQKVLAGKSPRERAAELVAGTRMKDVANRKKLYQTDLSEFAKSPDTMIQLALLLDAPARDVRKIIEAQGETKQQAYARIGKIKFAMEGASNYPDATFTLRLAFGQVKGYEEGGKPIPFETTIAGLYERGAEHKNKPPFDIPTSWLKQKNRLNLNTPFDFVSTCDIIGGNSGSPVINQNAELVGLIFDGNIQSLVLDFVYSDTQARAVAVHSSALLEALRKVYDAAPIADELTGKKRSTAQ